MFPKTIGALMIVCGFGGIGMLFARYQKTDAILLRELSRILERMRSELEYRLTPVPDLLRIGGQNASEPLRRLFSDLAGMLDTQCAADASEAMEAILSDDRQFPSETRQQLYLLAETLGCYDLNGQVRGLQDCRNECIHQLELLENNQQQRLRSYRTLGFCTGAALAILLF